MEENFSTWCIIVTVIRNCFQYSGKWKRKKSSQMLR